MEKDATRAPEHAEKGQVMFNVSTEQLTLPPKGFAGAWRVV